jgi:hypothetical protein
MPKVAKKEQKVSKRAKVEEPKKRKRKAKKDPNAPKNPMSAYLLFCEEWREKVKAQNPNSSFGKDHILLIHLRGGCERPEHATDRQTDGKDLVCKQRTKRGLRNKQ